MKIGRHAKILELIQKNEIGTQDELSDAGNGFTGYQRVKTD